MRLMYPLGPAPEATVAHATPVIRPKVFVEVAFQTHATSQITATASASAGV